ncbi:hypothetical protein XarjCFBP7652_15450 [Xanthomonas arboricola]|nr:hypothetical protein XarjCFBP7652_15450 [Xanthomonas arboricola]
MKVVTESSPPFPLQVLRREATSQHTVNQRAVVSAEDMRLNHSLIQQVVVVKGRDVRVGLMKKGGQRLSEL